uniref:Myosin motor domain-containing protein n=1 Tax=Globisporangium ultimum (strain ATCC 200006 / CBS 805.95 / DAOM BR144) TaxID=431595 RepID=K3X5U3_GLOUD
MTASKEDSALGVSVGSRCYIPDKQRMWLPVVVEDVNEQKRKVTVKLEALDGEENSGNEQRRVVDIDDKTVLPLQNTTLTGTAGCDDMIELNHLHEAAILYNLKKRFHARLPYTYTGDICLAVNPYQWIEELYSKELHTKYLRARNRKHLPPHVYAIAVSSYQHMKQNGVNQSILVSGESGAGKTETTKIVMDNLASIASGSRQETITKIIEVNPLLESFGNAKTKRNDNSSRFGKFTQLQFDRHSVLCGAKCETYLLEKTRVITQEPGERNYHIFYELLHGTTQQEKEMFGLEANNATFAYIQEDASLVEKDKKNFAKTKKALTLLGLSTKQQETLFQIIAGILHLGEAEFEVHPQNEDASKLRMDSVAYSNLLLGLHADAMDKALCNRTMKAGGEVYAVPLSVDHAKSCRDALAKAIYANIFDWMAKCINDSLSADDLMVNAIGVLDIFGFESFVHNSYEQLCINYANEKLQQKFTQDVFKSVAEEYERENITWGHIEYADNQEVLSLIEGKMGIISLLNEEIVRPKGNEEGFVGKLGTQYRTSKKIIEFARISKTQFTIHHYADSVKYEAMGFLEKHKDALLPDLSELMRSSTEPFLQSLFEKKEASPADPPAGARPGPRKRSAGGDNASTTVGTQFKLSLNKLMENINLTNTNYIRCIKPNSVKSTTVIDEQMVVNQLRCAGVIEAICIARAGYPNRLLHGAFATEFDIFLTEEQIKQGEPTANCRVLVKQFNLKTPEEYQMGTTKIYLQKGVLERLDHAKAAKLFAYVALIQSTWRGLQARRMYATMRAALVIIQRRVKVFVAVTVLQRKKAAIATIQRVWRGHVGRKEFFAALCKHRALQIQRVWRGHAGRKLFVHTLRTDRSIRIQCCVRQFLARKELHQRMGEFQKEQARFREIERRRVAEEQRLHRILCERKVLVIQKLARGYLARCAFFKLVRHVEAEKRRLEREEEERRIKAEEEEKERQHIAEEQERERLRILAEEEEKERERLRIAAEKEERARQRRIAEEQVAERQRQLAKKREEEERQRRIAEEQEQERQRQREEEERERLRLLELEKQEQAAVAVQKVTRGRLARQKFGVLKIEAMKEEEELNAAREENARLRKQLEEILEANIELETLVAEWQSEREVLDASNNLKELDLKQRINSKKKLLEDARMEYNALSDSMDKTSTTPRSTDSVDTTSSGSTEVETLSSASEPEDDDDDWDHHHSMGSPYFDADRPSTDVSHLLEKRSTFSKPRLSHAMQQRKEKTGRLFMAGAKQLGMAKKWVTTTRQKKANSTATVSDDEDEDDLSVGVQRHQKEVSL